MTGGILKKRKHNELNSIFSEFARRRAESGFRPLEKKKNIKLNSHDNPKEEKTRFGLSRKWLNEKKSTLTLLFLRHFLQLKNLLERKISKNNFSTLKKTKT